MTVFITPQFYASLNTGFSKTYLKLLTFLIFILLAITAVILTNMEAVVFSLKTTSNPNNSQMPPNTVQIKR